MKKPAMVSEWIKQHIYFIFAVSLAFILVSPTEIWDIMYGQFNFVQLVFTVIALILLITVITLLFALPFSGESAKRRLFFRGWLRERMWLMFYIAAIFIAIVTSADPMLSLSYLPISLCGPFLVYIIDSGKFTYKKLIRILCFAALGLLISSVVAFIQRIGGIEVNKSFTNLTVNPNMPGRVDSVFGNPNVYGFVLASVLPLTAAYALGSKNRLRWVIGGVSFLAGIAALIMTYSRGAWLAFAVAALIFVALYKPKLIPVILLLGAAAIPFIPGTIKDRLLTIFNPADTSISYRGTLMGSAVKLIADNLLLGAGLGMNTVRPIIHALYWPTDLDPIYQFYHAHNILLQLWCEMGAVGVITFFGMLIQGIVRALRGLRSMSKQGRLFTSLLVAGVAAMLLCGITDAPLTTPRTMMLFWILFGLMGTVRKAEEHINPSITFR